MYTVLLASSVVGITGILIGVLLGIASEYFAVEVDEKEILVREALPGNNCGGCGFPGCDGLAKAIALGQANVDSCPVGGSVVAKNIAKIIGVSVTETVKKVAYVRCAGTCQKTKEKYVYFGVKDCNQMKAVPGFGSKSCQYGCMGYGSCVKACKFDAIHIVDGIALVDKEKCTACGKCITACPKNLIELVPYNQRYLVQCYSQDKGKEVKEKCTAGCIGCTMCTKVCQDDAIHMNGNVAQIDYEKCINCGKCAAKCPVKVIEGLLKNVEKPSHEVA